MTGGMAYEAMNHAGHLGLDMLVVYNDNDMSISENVGALRNHSARVAAKLGFPTPHREAESCENAMHLAERPGALFETLGFAYHGPIDGHDLDALLTAFEQLKDAKGPQFLHIITTKGKGFEPAEGDPIKYHGVTQFDPVTGAFPGKKPGAKPTYTQVFGDWLCETAARDPKLVAITPAMREGSGLVEYSQKFPKRYFDCGIAEQHAVTLAAGLACEGLKPVCAIYSTFLQRGYDQLIHDVAIQNLPVRFAIDRAGLVGADGSTHAGSFDITYLATLPNMVVMSPSDEAELVHMTYTAVLHDSGPIAFRYPRGNGTGVPLPEVPQQLEIGKGRIVREGKKVAILSLGTRLAEAMKAADTLDAKGLSTTVADLRFAKPLDEKLIRQLIATHEVVVTVEEASVGGLGAHVLTLASDAGLMDTGLKIRTMRLPDIFQEHDSPQKQYDEAGLNAQQIVETVLKALRHNSAGVEEASVRA